MGTSVPAGYLRGNVAPDTSVSKQVIYYNVTTTCNAVDDKPLRASLTEVVVHEGCCRHVGGGTVDIMTGGASGGVGRWRRRAGGLVAIAVVVLVFHQLWGCRGDGGQCDNWGGRLPRSDHTRRCMSVACRQIKDVGETLKASIASRRLQSRALHTRPHLLWVYFTSE